ncbi:hypothetical protein K456DRAFT_516062 [Colletotrichum gloeosporioides 23]|nr:hypothetical protein K456DRAFT_516062 [Colletotrichum gloeosporioides 23]
MCFDNTIPTQPPPATIKLRHHQCVQTSRQSGWPVQAPQASDSLPHYKLQTTPSPWLPHPINSRIPPSPAKQDNRRDDFPDGKESSAMTTTCHPLSQEPLPESPAFHAMLFSDFVPRPCCCLSTAHKDFKTSFGGRAAKPSQLTTITTTEWPNRLLPPTPGGAVLELLMTPRRVMSLPSPGSFLWQGGRRKIRERRKRKKEKKKAQAQSSQMLFFSRFAGESQLPYRGSGPQTFPKSLII